MEVVTKTPEQWADFIESVLVEYTSVKAYKVVIIYSQFAPMGCARPRGKVILKLTTWKAVNEIMQQRKADRLELFKKEQHKKAMEYDPYD